MSLTAVEVRQAKPGTKQYKRYDGRGLYLLVMPNGGKYWRLKYRFGDKEKALALGTADDVSLKEARDKRDEARAKIANGIDPMEERKHARKAAHDRAGNTFKAIAEEWHQKKRDNWTENYANRVLRSLKRDLFPVIGNRPITEINASAIREAIAPIEARGSSAQARRVLQQIAQVFDYAMATDRAEYNPTPKAKAALKSRKPGSHAALSRDQLPEFLSRLHDYDGYVVTRLALEMIVLTFVRYGELRGAEWGEIDFDRAEWRIPAARMKMRDEHIVPLSRQALDVLKELRPITGHHRYVFSGASRSDRPISEKTLLRALYRMGYQGQATVHGFRATASTILNESGFNSDAIERQLAHIERNRVRAAYHRAQYLHERRKMMQWWADFLDSQRRGANVVPIGGAS